MKDFAEALCRHVAGELVGHDGEYLTSAVKVVDARNHLFRTLPCQYTDEAEDVYAMSDLCCIDEEMNTKPDMKKALSVARNYFG